jgi:hypothetical protein
MSSVPNWAVASAIAALILLTPVIAFLMIVRAEAPFGFLIEAKVAAFCIAAACIITWVLFRRRSLRSGTATQSGSEEENDKTAIAAPPR